MSDERNVTADTIRIAMSEEGMAIDFGRDVTPEGSDHQIVETVSKVLLAPATFHRFGIALQEAVRGLPRDPAAPAPAGPPPNTAAVARPALEELLEPTRDLPSSRADAPSANQLASRLLGLIADLGAPYAYERSFRMRPGEMLPNRFLLSVGRPDDGSASDEALTAVFRALDLPAPFLEATQQNLPLARCVHFGFEGDGESPLLKVYLEVAGKVDVDDTARADEGAVLEHMAYKWDPADAERRAVGSYFWYPHLTADEIRSRVAGIYDGSTPESQEIAFGVIELAAARMPERDIHYLEIAEQGNERCSYSINFYDADMKIRDLHPLLSRIRRQYDVAPGRFQVLYDQIKTRRFGHLAGGVHRNGKDFFNIYYGPQFFDTQPEGPWRNAMLRGEAERTAARD